MTGGAQESRFHQGAQYISNCMAQSLGHQVVRLDTPVHTIAQNETGVRVVTDRGEFQAKRAIVAIPPTLAGRLRYYPALPGFRDQLTQRIPMGTVIKVQCLYATPFWRAHGLSGQAISDSGAVRITFDNSPEQDMPGILLGFVEETKAALGTAEPASSKESGFRFPCTLLRRGRRQSSGICRILLGRGRVFTRRYAGYMPPGVWTAYGEALREPIGRIIGRARKPRLSGWATWTVHCNQVSAPRQRCLPRLARASGEVVEERNGDTGRAT